MPASLLPTSRAARWGLVVLVLGLLGVAGYAGAVGMLNRFLNGAGLQQKISEKTGALVDAPSGFLPFRWSGLSMESGGFLAEGKPGRALRLLRATNLRGHCEIVDLWKRSLRVKSLSVEHLQGAVSGDPAALPALALPAKPPLYEPRDEPSAVDLDLQEIDVAHLDLAYGAQKPAAGAFRDVHTRFWTKEKTLLIRGEGGTFRHGSFPEARVLSCDLQYLQPELRILAGKLAVGSGSVEAKGQFTFTQPGSMKLDLAFRQCMASLFLPAELRGKFESTFESDTTIQEGLDEGAQATASGRIACHGAVLKNLDGLEKAAAFTHEPRLRELKIQRLSGIFRSQGDDLVLQKIEAEAKGLLALEGECTVHGDALEGEFQLGVSEHLLEHFPGAREEVFTRHHDGYFWTTVHLRGTTKKPRQDLKPRLVKAAEKYFAKKLLAPLLKPGAAVIHEIDELF